MSLAYQDVGNAEEVEYAHYIGRMNKSFDILVDDGGPLFQTTVTDLFDTYLAMIPPEDRQYHNCSCCRHFVNHYGNLAYVDGHGMLHSAIWNEGEAPEYYLPAVRAMRALVERSAIVGPMISSEKMWGARVTGPWRHLSLITPKSLHFKPGLKTAGQTMAEKREDYKNVSRSLAEYKVDVVEMAVKLLKTDSLYRSEKVLGNAEWLLEVHRARMGTGAIARNVLWKYVATAPAGFCHPRSSMIGTLLDDIAAGMSYEQVASRFKDKMHPLQYQRPTAAPAAGAIKRAEEIVERLGIANSLRRRFARLWEVKREWEPHRDEDRKPAASIFAHLKPKDFRAMQDLMPPPITMTWVKFRDEVLPTAEKIDYMVDGTTRNFTAFVTAAVMDAPPILLWDNEDERNPFSTYLWTGGSLPHQWTLQTGYVPVTGISYRPNMWFRDYPNQGTGVVFLLQGARETRSAGLALFPEILKSEMHEIRSVIEAFSARGELEEMEEASACGVLQDKGQKEWRCRLRVTVRGQSLEYKLDRWD